MPVVILLLLAIVAAAADPEADLRAAHAARAALEGEERAWSAERDGMQAAIDGLRQQEAEDRQSAKEATSRATALLVPDPEQAKAETQRRMGLLAPMGTLLARIALDALPQELKFHFYNGPSSSPLLSELADNADALLASGQRVEARVESGQLDGSPLAVRTIRCGLFLGWWLALDGSVAGVLRHEGPDLILMRSENGPAQAIRSAFAQLDGREPPQWIMVPHAP